MRLTVTFATATSSALFNRHEFSGVVTYPDLTGTGDFLFSVAQHFLPLRQPADGAGDGEEHGEHFWLEAHCLVNDAGVEIHVGVELPRHEVIVFQCNAFEF